MGDHSQEKGEMTWTFGFSKIGEVCPPLDEKYRDGEGPLSPQVFNDANNTLSPAAA
jgi:hypothetical protein